MKFKLLFMGLFFAVLVNAQVEVTPSSVKLPYGEQPIIVLMPDDTCVSLYRESDVSISNVNEVVKCKKGEYYERWETLVEQHENSISAGG